MEISRTLNELYTIIEIDLHHWQLLADLANNDYDIGYFGGKVTICGNLESYLRIENPDIKDVVIYLNDELEGIYEDIDKVPNNENYQGALEEVQFLLHYIYKEYTQDITAL